MLTKGPLVMVFMAALHGWWWRFLMVSLLVALAPLRAMAQPNEAVLALAQREKQPLLDTLKALVEIESGTADHQPAESVCRHRGRAFPWSWHPPHLAPGSHGHCLRTRHAGAAAVTLHALTILKALGVDGYGVIIMDIAAGKAGIAGACRSLTGAPIPFWAAACTRRTRAQFLLPSV